MAQFFKYFFAALLALVVFTLALVFILIGIGSMIESMQEVKLGQHTVLWLDLNKNIAERTKENPLQPFNDEEYDEPGVFDIVRMIRYAKTDSNIDGIYLKAGNNANGFGTSEEIRNALIEFRKSGKFVIAYGEVISQKAYHVANIAEKLYVHPKGGLDWKGFGIQYVFFKKALDRLGIEPQIFYAGKYKSATEPFREDHMTDANKLQSIVLLEDLYGHFLSETSKFRKIDTGRLRMLADSNRIRTAANAVEAGLVDGLRYEDEVKEEMRRKTGSSNIEKIPFVSFAKYAHAVNYKGGKGSDKIAIVYAEGNIVDGNGEEDQIGGDRFRHFFREARLDKKIKAIVVRVNSGGGSAMASENMWRELSLAKLDKPIILSFGDVAASGGYYMACNADSIFVQPNTITGSIGVFSIIPNMQGFFRDKMGVTFDGVETSPAANSPSLAEPLTDAERRIYQADVDSIYHTFLDRVARGRRQSLEKIDSIGQGRVWTGTRAIQIGLADRIGGLTEALASAAKMAKLKEYRVKEYPERLSLFDKLTGSYKNTVEAGIFNKTGGKEFRTIFKEWEFIKNTIGEAQAKIPFQIIIR